MRRCSGIQPSGELHLGNYFGAIRPQIERQDGAFVFVADLHALTTIRDREQLVRNRRDLLATYLALGLDPKRATLFVQSDVPEVAELAWLLACVAPIGLFERAVSYKDRVARGLPTSLGLFFYPALMAADILAYRTDRVLVGSDQAQHVEICRDVASAFHAAFGVEVFRSPETELGVPVPIPGTDGAKMSKTYRNHIPIFAEPSELEARISAIRTDSKSVAEPKNPEECTVFALYSLFATDQERREMADRYTQGGFGYGDAKRSLAQLVATRFEASRTQYHEYLAHPSTLDDVAQEGARKAREVASSVLEEARAACGLAVRKEFRS